MQEYSQSTSSKIRHNDLNAVQLFHSIIEAGKESAYIHAHTKIELSLILSGTGIYRTKKRDYKVAPGDVYFFRPNESHYLTDIESSDVALLNLQIAPYYLYANSYLALTPECIEFLSPNYKLGSHRINDFGPEDHIKIIASSINNIRFEMQNEENDFDICVQNYISIISIYLARILPPNRAEDSAARNAYQKIGSAVEFINQHFRENITLEIIAEQVGYSRSYFSSEFRKWMGMTTWNYISIKRIEEALTLIKTTDLSILEIALACGFNNAANFGKTFKKYTNLTPSSFRP